MTIVFKPSDNIKGKMIEYYEDLSTNKNVPYSVFQAEEGGTIITMYTSGKVVFQGISADIDAALWIDQEKFLNNRDVQKEIDADNKKKEDKKDKELDYTYYNMSTIGSDEVGTGDYFGPVVVTASYVSKNDILLLTDLKVRDSKKITDDKILKIAPTLIKKIPHVTYILDNKTYNEQFAQNKYNMNQVKAILHNKVLCALVKKDNYDYERIIMDQFVYPKKYFEHIASAKEKVTKITFLTHAEDVVLSVAVSSIISRYIFLKEMDKISSTLGFSLQKGASTIVDEQGKKIVKDFGKEKLFEIAKINFKNTEKILSK